ncbi:MAG TPA: T9SS type A sorting domain-containing protein, partial [Chitinophagales bacterium]|nr:T9SS type A sorting domain-containing protein [Chitinophagales bacterium]
AVGSQGYFKFKLAQRSGNQAGDIIVHRASIYFDNNSPLLTNQAKVLIIDSAINTGFVNLTDENEVRIFPNPTDGVFEVMCKEAGSIKVCDIAGKSVTGNGLVAGVNLIDISQYPAGVYFLSIFTNRWSKTYKVLKK